MRVDFMMIGAQKSGTTSLAAQLAAHPQICFCREKEPAYFHQVADWRAELDHYHALYDPRPGQLLGEASTHYTFFPQYRDTAARLYEYNPALKLIYIMRQPVDRIVSLYSHNFVRDIDREADDAAIAHAVIAMAHSLGLQVTAEGVENEAQLALLRQYGCNDFQGYLFSRPVPAEEFSLLLQNGRSLPAEPAK